MRDYSKMKEHMDKIDNWIAETMTMMAKQHLNYEDWTFKQLNKWRDAYYDSQTFMFYALCLIHQYGEDGSLKVTKETGDWFEDHIQNNEEIEVRITQEDLEDDSMKLTIVESLRKKIEEEKED